VGCDFPTIQAAVDGLGVAQPTGSGPVGGAVIEVREPVHTEAGIVFASGVEIIIRGLGADQTVVQAHETVEDSPERVFLVEEGAVVVLEGMTIRHGRPSAEEEHGGGIDNRGTLLIRNCTVTKNSARGGGGISNRKGDLTIVGSTFSDNVARGDGPPALECGGGGGVKCSSGTMRLENSAVTDNRAGLRSEGLEVASAPAVRVRRKSSTRPSAATVPFATGAASRLQARCSSTTARSRRTPWAAEAVRCGFEVM
jgi:hypothetical protein